MNKLPQAAVSKIVDSAPAVRAEPRLLRSESLLGDSSEVSILHRGAVYRLRATSQGKLILTK